MPGGSSTFTFAFQNYGRVFATHPPWGAHLFQFEAPTWLWLQRWSRLFLLVEAAALLLAARRGFERRERVRLCLLLLGVFAVLSILYHPDYIKVGFVLPFLLIPGASRKPGTLVVDGMFSHEDDGVRQALEHDYELVDEVLVLRVYRRRGDAGAP